MPGKTASCICRTELAENVNQRGHEFIALRLMTLIGQRFQHGEPAAVAPANLRRARHPHQACATGFAAACSPRGSSPKSPATEPAYLPARPLDAITAHHVLRAVRAGSGQDIATRDEPARAEVLGEFAKIEEAERAAASSVTLLALVNRAQKQIEDAGPKST